MAPETAPFTGTILALQALASGGMCGLIWFVQLVHYPLFRHLEGQQAQQYSLDNQRRTPWVVIPLMLMEMITALCLVIWPPVAIGRGMAIVGVGLILAIWGSTAGIQMPLHARLERKGHPPEVVAKLVQSNWLRTALWTARAVLAVWMMSVAG
ncbi:MAG: hypothetical protein WCJ21_06420 [Planctomycetota bacterium]